MALPHAPLQQVHRGTAAYPGGRVLLEGPPGLERPRADESVSQDMLNYISQRVHFMLGNITRSSELQVHAELRRVESSFAALADKIQRVEMLLSQKAVEAKGKEPVSQENLDRALATIQQRRDQELAAIKRDLHQTIMVHNHNADLMADHKAAIERINGMIEEPTEDGLPPLSQVHRKEIYQHLLQIGATLERAQGEQDIDALLERGEAILLRVNSIIASSAAAMYQPSMPGHPGLAHLPYGAPDPYLSAGIPHMPLNPVHPIHPCLGL